MLTQSEREWLNEREIILACEGCYIWDAYWEDGVELKTMQDAADFEARVAAKLAHYVRTPCVTSLGDCPHWRKGAHCPRCRLKHARLQVEEELDGYNTM